ncbi:MAG: wax ester/triacylglycerol synthase family O-acyltransferase [Sandaracinus sp.]|nr:wax ester/triacylglycerol synthase family O-acyltransferase [Sandaracinus sp.]MCB9621560.1 wax ester/triacylglycerol synthase family O-acyltransferase [Sandaracinus sp.]
MERPLSPADRAWLRMERPDNLMVITGVLAFDAPFDRARLRALVAERLTYFPRFRQTVVNDRWCDDPRFDLEAHLLFETLPEPADRATVRRRIGELLGQPLDPTRPLWRMHVLENPRDGRTLLVARLHHCLADGFALLHVMLSLTDDRPDAPIERELSVAREQPGLVWRRMVGDALGMMWRGATRVRETPAVELLARGGEVARDLLRLATLPTQPRSLLRGPLSHDKRAAWSKPVPVEAVRAVAKRHGATINDVLLGAVAGALRSYLLARGEDVSGFDLRTVVPFNLRKPEEMDELGNRFGLVFVDLPVGEGDPIRRIERVRDRMRALKRSPEPFVLWRLVQLAGAGPVALESLVVRILGAKATAVMTNVPGPREPRFLAGNRIQTIMFWVPQSGRVGLGVSIFSYAGEVRLGVAVDAALVPDPERVLEAFEEELRGLAAR